MGSLIGNFANIGVGGACTATPVHQITKHLAKGQASQTPLYTENRLRTNLARPPKIAGWHPTEDSDARLTGSVDVGQK